MLASEKTYRDLLGCRKPGWIFLMTYSDSSVRFSVQTTMEFPVFGSGFEETIEFIFEAIYIEAEVSQESTISFDVSDWRIVKEIKGSRSLGDSDQGSVDIHWDIEAEISHPTYMTPNQFLQEIEWTVIPNTAFDDEFEITSVKATLA